jgi:hypothetical protein
MNCTEDRLASQPAVTESSAERPRVTLGSLIQTLAAEGSVELVVKRPGGRQHRLRIHHLPEDGDGEQRTTLEQVCGERAGERVSAPEVTREPSGPELPLPDAGVGGGPANARASAGRDRAEVGDCQGVLGSWYPRRGCGYIFNGGGGPWQVLVAEFSPDDFKAVEAEITRRAGARPWPDRVTGLHLPVIFNNQEPEAGERFARAKRIRLAALPEDHGRMPPRPARLPSPESFNDDNFAPRGGKPWEEMR